MNVKLLEIGQIGNTNFGILDIPRHFWPNPGQYLSCQNLTRDTSLLPTQLFKVFGPENVRRLGPMPKSWQPGDSLAILPPQGKGFKLPLSARRVGLLTFSVSPIYLLTLAETSLAQGASISLFCESIPPKELLNHVPSRVEVTQISSLKENLNWPEYLAADIEHHELEKLSGLLAGSELPFPGQVLIRTSMPCRGLGNCGVCAVKTRSGWRNACVDGPVFPMSEVLHVA